MRHEEEDDINGSLKDSTSLKAGAGKRGKRAAMAQPGGTAASRISHSQTLRDVKGRRGEEDAGSEVVGLDSIDLEKGGKKDRQRVKSTQRLNYSMQDSRGKTKKGKGKRPQSSDVHNTSDFGSAAYEKR